jgi:starch synthase (maltosyl-transferring)
MVHFPLHEFGIEPGEQYRATELLGGETYLWTGGTQYVRLDPHDQPVQLFALRRWNRVDYAEPCY